MPICARCGESASEASRFCPACGAPLGSTLRPRQEVRKTVTVLFCDVVESTALGDRADPETVRQAMSRFFDEMRRVVERHGGIVERFRGDEVMAVFGVPAVHEDDALRATRAGMAMQRRLKDLNSELLATWGVELECRIGINTGEVVAGDPGTGATFITGDAVNLAKRLEQAASAGEILIGTATYPLVKDAVRVGPRERFSVKGKREPVFPFRLEDVDATAAGVARQLDAPLVDREEELLVLQAALEQCERQRQCRLGTVIGAAGVGKSRLAVELLASRGQAVRALRGRCLPYGEAITYWPLVEVFRDAGGEESLAQLAAVDDGALIADVIRAIVGTGTSDVGGEGTFWAIRRYLEELARERPLVVCFEDVHWAAPTFLDLIEYLAGWLRDAPVLLLVLARSDLLDVRPSWVTPRPNSTLLPLEPLTDADAGILLDRLGGAAGLSRRAQERIADAAEGNPLFVEQMVAMAAEAGADEAELPTPPTIQALLAERLDRLSEPERTLLERASVFGKEFSYRAVIELSPEDARGDALGHLFSLVRKELVRPVHSSTRYDLLAFRHDLIRAAAYDAMPKVLRAALHERLANWVEQQAGDELQQLEEVIGYHLEQAYRYLAELRVPDQRSTRLAERAALLLGGAGRRAGARGDARSATDLLRRAVSLPGTDERRRIEWQLDLAAAQRESGELRAAQETLDAADAQAEAFADVRLKARADVEQLFLRVHTAPIGWPSRAESSALRAIEILEPANDDFGLARAWTVVALAHYFRCHVGRMESVLDVALGHARRGGAGRQASTILNLMARAALVGPAPASEALRRCDAIAELRADDKALEAVLGGVRAVLHGMQGSFEVARALYQHSQEVHADLGMSRELASTRTYSGTVELLAGDPLGAEREFEAGYVLLEQIGDTFNLSTLAALLAEALRRQGRTDDAWEYTQVSERTSAPFDVFSEVAWRTTRARISAERGDRTSARDLAEEAAARARGTDNINLHAEALLALGEITADHDGAGSLKLAISLFDSKESTVEANVARRALERVTVGA